MEILGIVLGATIGLIIIGVIKFKRWFKQYKSEKARRDNEKQVLDLINRLNKANSQRNHHGRKR